MIDWLIFHEGKVLQTFEHDKGHNLFICPRYIIVNSAGDSMYVSDSHTDTVTSLSMDGKVWNRYKHDTLSYPVGLTLVDDDSIYVIGYLSNNIHQITPTCTSVRIVLEEKDGLLGPRTMCYITTQTKHFMSVILYQVTCKMFTNLSKHTL